MWQASRQTRWPDLIEAQEGSQFSPLSFSPLSSANGQRLTG